MSLALVGALCGWRSAGLGLGDATGNAAYHFQQWRQRPELTAELDRSLALNPRLTGAWIARGLAAEAAGDRAAAEASLLRASATDATYLPYWTLANFYVRSGETDRFWMWARRAAGLAYEPSAVFQLCWRVSSDPAEILQRAIPPEGPLRRAYLDFLVRTDRLEAAAPLAPEFSSDLELMLRYCDAALAKRLTGAAWKAWSGLPAQRGPTPGRCFDWRPHGIDGATVSIHSALRVSLSGKQPESCDLAERYLPLEPGARYRLRFRYQTGDLPAGSGLEWLLLDAATGAAFGEAAAAVPLEFSAPPDCDLARLVLRYRRPSGRIRAEGSAVFENIIVERAG